MLSRPGAAERQVEWIRPQQPDPAMSLAEDRAGENADHGVARPNIDPTAIMSISTA